MIAQSRKLIAFFQYLDSPEFLGWAAQWSGLALQFGTGPALIINGFANSHGLPLLMTVPTVGVFLFRSRLFVKKEIPAWSELAGLLVWGILAAQSLAYGASIL